MLDPQWPNLPVPSDHAQLYRLLVAELTDFAVFLMDQSRPGHQLESLVERLLGYPEAAWVGQPASRIFTPEDQANGEP